MQTMLLLALSLVISVANVSCAKAPYLSDSALLYLSASVPAQFDTEPKAQADNENELTLQIQIEDEIITAILYDNTSTQDFLRMLPLTINMDDMNQNEKYFYFPEQLPTSNEKVENIKIGDLMLYGSDCLVLFYESFSTSYSYTRLGYIEDMATLS